MAAGRRGVKRTTPPDGGLKTRRGALADAAPNDQLLTFVGQPVCWRDGIPIANGLRFPIPEGDPSFAIALIPVESPNSAARRRR